MLVVACMLGAHGAGIGQVLELTIPGLQKGLRLRLHHALEAVSSDYATMMLARLSLVALVVQ